MTTDEQITRLTHKLEILQNFFKKDISKAYLFSRLAIIVFIFAFVSAGYLGLSGIIITATIRALIAFLFFSWLIIVWFYLHYSSKFSERFKSEIIDNIVQTLLPEAKYYHKQGFDSNILFMEQGSGIYDFKPSGNLSEDRIEAQLDGWKYESAELKVSRGYGKRRVTVFKGMVIKLTLPVKFSHNLIIQSKNLDYKAKYSNKIRLESQFWHETFDTYCEDNVFARYILNTAVMVRIEDLQKKYKHIGISFKDNNIYILWESNKDFWEPVIKLQTRYELEKDVRNYIESLNLVLNLVKELQLGREIWTRKEFTYKKKT